jgi:hypothetical protein
MLWPSMRRPAISVLFAIVGAAVLVWQIRDVGLDAVVSGLASVGWGFAIVLVLSFLRFTARAAAWMALLDEPAPIGRAVAAVIAGDAVGKTPLSLLLSEPAKALYLGSAAGTQRALAALAAENFFYAVSIALYITLGTGAMLLAFSLPHELVLAGGLALGGMAAILVGAAWLAWQRPSVVSAIVERLPSRRLAAVVTRIREFEVQAYGAAGGQGARLGRVALADLAFHLLSFAEAWVTLYLLTGQSLPLEAFVLDTFSRVANIVFNWVPMRIGVDQVGSRLLAEAIGQTAAIGLNLSLVRTLRQIAWLLVGIVLLGGRGTRRPA